MPPPDPSLAAANPVDLPELILNYLLPTPTRPGRRAHQFTANGFSMPFLAQHGFAAVVNPGERSPRYADMLSGLLVTRPGDLLFIFSADPRPTWSTSNRRGIYGIFRVTSHPFQATTSHIDGQTNYRVLGACQGCGSQTSSFPRWDRATRSWIAQPCSNCGTALPAEVATAGGPLYPSLVLPWRLQVEPFVLFERPVTDERAYSDWEDPGTIWVGRHDNQSAGTGRAGKGSSIRQLTAEEAHKLTRLLVQENSDCGIDAEPITTPYTGDALPITNANGSAASDPIVRRRPLAGDNIRGEFFLSVAVARQFDDPLSSFVTASGLAGDLPNLEYVSIFYPWGYTNATSDFVMRFSSEDGTPYKLVVGELKEDRISDGRPGQPGAIVQLGTYVPWVVSRLVHNAARLPRELEVVPIVIGSRLDANVAAPEAYTDVLTTPRGPVRFTVQGTSFIQYRPEGIYVDTDNNDRAGEIRFTARPDLPIHRIPWKARHALASSPEETISVRDTSWSEARLSVGLTE